MPVALLYVLLALCAGVFVFGIWVDKRTFSHRWLRHVPRFALALQVGGLASAYLVLRPGRGVDGWHALSASAATGRPVLLELYSNW
jgi:hypothetical protein